MLHSWNLLEAGHWVPMEATQDHQVSEGATIRASPSRAEMRTVDCRAQLDQRESSDGLNSVWTLSRHDNAHLSLAHPSAGLPRTRISVCARANSIYPETKIPLA